MSHDPSPTQALGRRLETPPAPCEVLHDLSRQHIRLRQVRFVVTPMTWFTWSVVMSKLGH